MNKTAKESDMPGYQDFDTLPLGSDLAQGHIDDDQYSISRYCETCRMQQTLWVSRGFDALVCPACRAVISCQML